MNGASPRAVIFAGPSLPPVHRPPDPRLEWRPPVRQGEVYEAALSRPAIIGIIDGYFEVTPTVWHKEILWAMSQGIHVYGSASIGALRAAELHTFGMVGIGRIFESFRDGVLEDDDEVAVLHGPEELGYPALTEAMVNIRATIEEAVAGGILNSALADQLARIAKTLFYKERSWGTIFRRSAGFRGPSLDRFTAWMRTGAVDQKRTDGLKMAAAILAHLSADVTPLMVPFRFNNTGYHQSARQHT